MFNLIGCAPSREEWIFKSVQDMTAIGLAKAFAPVDGLGKLAGPTTTASAPGHAFRRVCSQNPPAAGIYGPWSNVVNFAHAFISTKIQLHESGTKKTPTKAIGRYGFNSPSLKLREKRRIEQVLILNIPVCPPCPAPPWTVSTDGIPAGLDRREAFSRDTRRRRQERSGHPSPGFLMLGLGLAATHLRHQGHV